MAWGGGGQGLDHTSLNYSELCSKSSGSHQRLKVGSGLTLFMLNVLEEPRVDSGAQRGSCCSLGKIRWFFGHGNRIGHKMVD